MPPKGAPNVLLIMTDDVGFGAPGHLRRRHSDSGAGPHREGGPALHAISIPLRCARRRARRSSPAATITSPASGWWARSATGYPGYDSIILKANGTIGNILKDNGYATSWFGKDHNTPSYQATQAGPFDQWPTGMGFEYFYGFVGGDASQWEPNLFRNTTAIYPLPGQSGLEPHHGHGRRGHPVYEAAEGDRAGKAVLRLLRARRHPCAASSDAGVDRQDQRHALVRRRLEQAARDHLRQPEAAGHHARERQADRRGRRRKLPQWDSLSWEEKKLFIKQADVYGAYLAYTDHEIGRVIQAVEDLGQLDNTLIIYISGDNGASAEGMLNGTPNEFTTFNGISVPVKDQFLWYEFWGSDRTYPHFAAPWAWALDTPFKWVKQVASHFGGTAQGVAMSWPGHINDAGRHPPPVLTISSTSCRRSLKRPAFRNPRRSTASSSARWTA